MDIDGNYVSILVYISLFFYMFLSLNSNCYFISDIRQL